MKLIDLLVQELPKRGGRPDDCHVIAQDEDGQLAGYHPGTLEFVKYYSIYLSEKCDKYRVRNTEARDSAEMVTRAQYEAALAAAQQPVWNGEGLPPVGCECEMQNDDRQWVNVCIIAQFDGFSFGWNYDCRMVYFSDKSDEFRTIRSEADKKRNDAIAKITNAICGEIADTGMATAAKYAVRAYDAIARGDIPGIKLSD